MIGRSILAAAALLLPGAPPVPVPDADAAPAGVDADFGDGGTSPFYRYDGTLDRPGRMLRQETVGDRFAAPHGSAAMRILYSSTDGRFGRGVREASGLLYLPQGAHPAGGWPLLVWGHGTFGVADVCAPSWKGPTPRDAAYVDAWLAQGFAVVAPDYQGLGTRGVHPYLDRASEGRSVLDAARAALAAYPGRIANRVILGGQSQGSGAVLNATYLAPHYAPDLHLVGTVATGLVWSAPRRPGEADEVATTADGVRVTVLRIVSGGLKPGSPAPDALLSAKGALLRDAARRGCSRDLVPVVQQNGVTAQNAFAADPAAVEQMLLPLDAPRARLPVPIFIGTGLADTLIPPGRQYRAVAAMCRFGNRIDWHPYPGITHNGGSVFALHDAIPFAQKLLGGKTVATSCGHLQPPEPSTTRRADVPFND